MELTWCHNSEKQNMEIRVIAYKKNLMHIIMRSFAVCTNHQIMSKNYEIEEGFKYKKRRIMKETLNFD
jgi:hypothetical protein